MSATERRRGGGTDLGGWAMVAGAALWVLTGAVLWLGLHLGYALDGTAWPAQVPQNPLVLPIYAARGILQLTVAAQVCTVLTTGAALGLVIGCLLVWLRRRKPNRHIDTAAQHMGRGRELQRLTMAAAIALAVELGARTDTPGVRLGRTIGGNTVLWGDWETGEVDIWGPRTGKTTSRAIPAILEAPGAIVATSNRRDLVDATRDPRAAVGTVYVFDPARIIGETPTFYWDPLSYVLAGPEDPVVKAQALAGIFAAATTHPDAKSDKFFDPKGQALLGHLMLAAAVSGKTMVEVYRWVSREADAEPARLLDGKGYRGAADFVRGVINSGSTKQRGGIYATAELCITWMTNPTAVEWITPGAGRAAFVPTRFAATRDTLYLISREGRSLLGALTAGLTAAVCEAAELLASRSFRGRLPVPMVAVLDEVANVCRWPDLPDLYSHYGGRGIYLLSILQSWQQGEDCWGARGMGKLWSAATVRIYGGGNAEVEFLDRLRRLIGTYRPEQVSTGRSRHGSTVNYSEGSDDILDITDLSELRRGRQILFASGTRTTLIACRPWYAAPYVQQVKDSIAAHDPGAAETLAAIPVVDPEPDVLPAGALFRGRVA